MLQDTNHQANWPKADKHIWLICDTSKSGVGAMYGQGPQLAEKCWPAGFMSKKFSTAQHNYAMHELETLTILEAMMKWEDKLVGYHIHVIMDHKALEFFKTQSDLSPHQWQWMEYMSRFDFNITYRDLHRFSNLCGFVGMGPMGTGTGQPDWYPPLRGLRPLLV